MAMVSSAPEHLGDVLRRRCALALLAVGVVWRALRYLLQAPIWGDEAMLCFNFLEKDYAGLTRGLLYGQVAPVLFLWGELASFRLLGSSELALRLLPFLAGMGSLFLFWRLARLTLPPLAGTIAVGILAVAIWPVSMGSLIKPYSLDLFMALALLLPAAHWLHQPARARWLVVLVLLTPIAVFGSFPVVFIGGGISLALLPAAWRQEGWRARALFAAYNVVLVGSFLGNFLIVGKGQLQTPSGTTTTEGGMLAYWAEGFPPSSAWPLAKWLVLTHTGQMMAYPIGSSNGGSSLTALLFLVGAYQFWASRRRALLVLCAAPFALWFLAAVLHRYPYGGAGRLSQHAVPAICLCAGMGAAGLIERARSAALRRRWAVGVCALLVLVGIGGMIRELITPPREEWLARALHDLTVEARSGAPIVVLNAPEEVDVVFRWHLALCGDRVSWNGRIDWDKAVARGQFLCVRYRDEPASAREQFLHVPARRPARPPPDFVSRLAQSKQPWALQKAVTETKLPRDVRDPIVHVDEFRWALESGGRKF
jgi:hypothetical protein